MIRIHVWVFWGIIHCFDSIFQCPLILELFMSLQIKVHIQVWNIFLGLILFLFTKYVKITRTKPMIAYLISSQIIRYYNVIRPTEILINSIVLIGHRVLGKTMNLTGFILRGCSCDLFCINQSHPS